MGRIGTAFARAKKENRAALVAYLCAGDPDLETTVRLVLAAAESGADIIELGVPFSDPTADGEAIQRASLRALSRGASLAAVLRVAKAVRAKSEVPLLLFGYYNPILAYGEEKLVADAKDAGVDGFLVVDLPPEESAVLRGPAVAAGLDYVPLIAPTTKAFRVELVADLATSFIYYVSLTGVTGTAKVDFTAATARAKELQDVTGKPVAVGFGVRTPADVAQLAKTAEGVVVGSAIVRTIEDASSPGDAEVQVRALVSALRAGLTRSA